MFTNRYSGTCHYCQNHVAKGDGFYDYGNIYCTELVQTAGNPKFYGWHEVCLPLYNHNMGTHFTTADEANAVLNANAIAQIETMHNEIRDALINGGLAKTAATANVRSLTQVINKVLGADIAIDDMTYEQITKVNEELSNRIHRKERQANPHCIKCSGTGAFWKIGANNEYFDDGCWSCDGTGLKAKYRK